jgi:hypothetical protein
MQPAGITVSKNVMLVLRGSNPFELAFLRLEYGWLYTQRP